MAATRTATATPTPPPVYRLTLVARECDSYPEIMANRARNNIQESLRDLGKDTVYGDGQLIDPGTEQANQQDCRPLIGWRLTLGDGTAGEGPDGHLSTVTNPGREETTEGSVPQLDPQGAPTGGTLDGAVTLDLSAQELALAQQHDLWVQGGTPPDPLNNGLPGFLDKYGFGALRCAIDNLNGDNVEWVAYPTGVSHVYCYYYAVTPPLPEGAIIVRKELAPGETGSQTFRFTGNISYVPDLDTPRGAGQFDLTAAADRPGEVEFDRAEVLPDSGEEPWSFQEEVPPGWELVSLACTSTSGSTVNVDQATGRVEVYLAGGDRVVCTYVNRRAPTGPLSLKKTSQGGVGGPFRFQVSAPDGSTESYETSTTQEGVLETVISVGGAPSGTYTVTETLPPPGPAGTWSVERIECTITPRSTDLGAAIVVVDVTSGASGSCLFVNRFTPSGRIVIRKQTVGGFGTTTFEVEPARVVQPQGTPLPVRQVPHGILIATTTSDGQTVEATGTPLQNLPLGAYVITELIPTSPNGTWALESVSCQPATAARATGVSQVVTLTEDNPSVNCLFVDRFTPSPPVTPGTTPTRVPGVGGILDCVDAAPDGSFRAYWSTRNNNASTVTVPAGSAGNQARGAYTNVSGFPAFPPSDFAPGRSPFYPDSRWQTLSPPGTTLIWAHPGGTSTANRDSLPCSFHVFLDKVWTDASGQTAKEPPADLPESYRIVATGQMAADGSSNPVIVPSGAVCTYPRQGGRPVAPLQCVYTNTIPPALDNIGMWVQNASPRVYTVREENLPAPWVSSNTGTFKMPNPSSCQQGYQGVKKYCLHTVINRVSTPTPTITPGGPTLTPTPTSPPETPTPTATPTAPASPTGTAAPTEIAIPTETVGPGTPSPTSQPGSTNTPGPSPSSTPGPIASATPTATSTGGGGGGGSTSTPTPTLTATASATGTPVLPGPPGPEGTSTLTPSPTSTTPPGQPTSTPVPPESSGTPVVPASPTPPPTGVLPGPPVPTVPLPTAVAIQTEVAQGTPHPPAVQTQVVLTPGPVRPGLPGTGASPAAAAGAGGGPGAAGVALLATLGALGLLLRRARRP